MKIYTKHGDSGTTSLIGGARVAKDDPRVESYGAVDELSAQVAFLHDNMAAEAALADSRKELEQILSDLMTVASLLALDADAPQAVKAKMPSLPAAATERLEAQIDAMSASLPAVHYFTLPGGHPLVSQAHICRTVCRRAERACVSAAREFPLDPQAMAYLNRLSDYFYTLGRSISVRLNIAEIYWKPNE